MDPTESFDPAAATLVALRNDPDAMRAITERLKVTDIGPAEHFPTEHEVKQFVELAGDVGAAEELLRRARERVGPKQNITIKMTQQRGQYHGP
jgi:hypothetical protein